jgi:hypothetical protein
MEVKFHPSATFIPGKELAVPTLYQSSLDMVGKTKILQLQK